MSAPAWQRRVLLVSAEHDYADPVRGDSFSKRYFLPSLERLSAGCEPVWIDRAWHQPGACDERLLAAAESAQPDLIWITPYEHDIGAGALQRLREIAPTVAFMSDDHWRFDDYSSGYARAYDLIATTDPVSVPRYRALGGRVQLTEYAADPLAAAAPLEVDDDFLHDVSFVGLAHPWRAWIVDWLRRRGVDVACYGQGQPLGRLDYGEMPGVFQRSRINLNLSNSRQHDTRFLLADPRNFLVSRETRKGSEQIKGRHFEIPMAGGFQLSYFTVGLDQHFRIGEELAVYATPEDLLAQIQIALADAERRCAIARAGWQRARRDHTWDARVAELLAAVWGPVAVEARA